MIEVKVRSIVMVDVENALGSPTVTRGEVASLMSQLEAAFGVTSQYVLAASHSLNALEIGLACPGRSVIWMPGKDGADQALYAEIVNPTTLSQFDRIVLVSGDGIFSSGLAVAAHAGVATTVLSRRDALSPKLRLAAHRTITFVHTTEISEVA